MSFSNIKFLKKKKFFSFFGTPVLLVLEGNVWWPHGLLLTGDTCFIEVLGILSKVAG